MLTFTAMENKIKVQTYLIGKLRGGVIMPESKINLAKLKNAREEANLTLKEVADMTGFKAAGTISRFESGSRSIRAEYLMKVSKIYRKPVEYFFD